MPDVFGTNGELLFTHEQLQAKLNPRKAARRPPLPAWMHQLVWPPSMVHAMRAARRSGDISALRGMLIEGKMLLQAEQKGLAIAAAAIRNQLTIKYERNK